MKKLLAFLIFLSSVNLGSSQTNDVFFKDADAFFKTYVFDGKVKYTEISTVGKLELANLIDFIANHTYSEDIKKAYLINAYNLFVIDQIISHHPISSPMDVPGFFEDKNSVLNGEMIALNTLENDLLRKTYKDPRFHFVLVCGGLGCPPITNFVYTPAKLEEQIEIQTGKALNNSDFVYQKDEEKKRFTYQKYLIGTPLILEKNNKEILAYINTYRKTPFSLDYKVKNYSYNWSLNNNTTTLKRVPVVTEAGSVVTPTSSGGQSFNAGSLLRKGQFDFTLFNTMYTQTKSEWLGQTFNGPRATFNTYLIQMTYGNSKSKRINIGLDLYMKSSGSSSDLSFKGVSNAFNFTNTDSTRAGLASVGVKLKFQPFKAHQAIKKIGKPKDDIPKEIEVY